MPWSNDPFKKGFVRMAIEIEDFVEIVRSTDSVLASTATLRAGERWRTFDNSDL